MSFPQQFKNALAQNLVDFHGITYGEVTKYNADPYTADVQYQKFMVDRVSLTDKNIKYPKAYDLPINFLGGTLAAVKADLEVGDIVMVAFSASEIRSDGEPTSDKSKFLSRDNAVILGSIGSAGDSPAIRITNTSIVFTIGLTTFTIDASGATVVTAGVSVNLLTHIHGTPAGPSAPPTPGT